MSSRCPYATPEWSRMILNKLSTRFFDDEIAAAGSELRLFTDTAAMYGLPAATLTDNGSVYTSRFTHGHNDFERLLNSLSVTQKTATPATRKHKEKLSASTEPSNSGSANTGVPRHWTTYNSCSTPSPRSTTPNDPTAPTAPAPHRTPSTTPCPKHTPPQSPSTSASATTLNRPGLDGDLGYATSAMEVTVSR